MPVSSPDPDDASGWLPFGNGVIFTTPLQHRRTQILHIQSGLTCDALRIHRLTGTTHNDISYAVLAVLVRRPPSSVHTVIYVFTLYVQSSVAYLEW